jgi:hypothetical protein
MDRNNPFGRKGSRPVLRRRVDDNGLGECNSIAERDPIEMKSLRDPWREGRKDQVLMAVLIHECA